MKKLLLLSLYNWHLDNWDSLTIRSPICQADISPNLGLMSVYEIGSMKILINI